MYGKSGRIVHEIKMIIRQVKARVRPIYARQPQLFSLRDVWKESGAFYTYRLSPVGRGFGAPSYERVMPPSTAVRVNVGEKALNYTVRCLGCSPALTGLGKVCYKNRQQSIRRGDQLLGKMLWRLLLARNDLQCQKSTIFVNARRSRNCGKWKTEGAKGLSEPMCCHSR